MPFYRSIGIRIIIIIHCNVNPYCWKDYLYIQTCSQLYYKNKDRMNENSTLLERYTFEYILTSFKNLLKCAKSAEHRKKTTLHIIL